MTTSPAFLTVFVNQQTVRVPAGAEARQAVQAADPALADRLAAGQAHLTDARGLRLDPAAPLVAGAIVRVVISARQPADPDAHP